MIFILPFPSTGEIMREPRGAWIVLFKMNWNHRRLLTQYGKRNACGFLTSGDLSPKIILFVAPWLDPARGFGPVSFSWILVRFFWALTVGQKESWMNWNIWGSFARVVMPWESRRLCDKSPCWDFVFMALAYFGYWLLGIHLDPLWLKAQHICWNFDFFLNPRIDLKTFIGNTSPTLGVKSFSACLWLSTLRSLR